MQSDSCQTPGPSEAPTHCHQTSGWLCATSQGTTDKGTSWSPGKLYRRSANSRAAMLHTEVRPCQWAMPSPARIRGIETHNAIADNAGIRDMPPRKRTTSQTQPACAGSQRLVPDANFLLACGHAYYYERRMDSPIGDKDGRSPFSVISKGECLRRGKGKLQSPIGLLPFPPPSALRSRPRIKKKGNQG